MKSSQLQDPRLHRDSVKKTPKGDIGRRLVAQMEQITFDRIGQTGIDNIRKNTPLFSKAKTIRDLRGETFGKKGNSAVIIAAGPSLKRTNIAERLTRSGFNGTVITSDSSLWYCLRNGIVPDLVVSLDPHATRIVRWFGDPQLNADSLKADDYFSRQDMDEAFADEQRANKEILRLLDQHGSKIRIALATCASEAVVRRVRETGMQIYWWNPMYDDYDRPQSLTAKIFEENKIPCLNAGGNVGSACWMIADAVLGRPFIGLTGMDFSYYDETPYRNTQYYYEAIQLVGESNLDSIYIRLFNPHLKKWFYTDPAYMWYRQCLLEMVQETQSRTFNCTEGGILFGDRIEFTPIEVFIRRSKCGSKINGLQK